MSALDARPEKESEVWHRLEDAVSQLVTVRVATVITQVKVTFTDQGTLGTVTEPGTEATDALITNVNLIGGDVTTIIAENLKNDTDLRTFHDGLVQKAITVLPTNLKALADAAAKIFHRGKEPE